MGKIVTLCDHTFLDHTKSASIGGDNIGVGPTHFEWEYAEADKARFVTDGDIKHARGKGQVAWLLEPQLLHPENYKCAYDRRGEFDAMLVHNKSFCAFTVKALWYPYGGSWISFDDFGMYKKTKLVSILLSEKNTMPGHIMRHEIVEKLGNKIDVFHGIPHKIDALAPYRYSIIIESERKESYFTEKLIDCLSVGTVPIYYGANLNNFFDTRGIIQVGDVNAISSVLKIIGEKDYESRKSGIEGNIMLARKYAICEDSIHLMYPRLFNDN